METGLALSIKPTWSPDGEQILFEGAGDHGEDAGLYVARADGSEARMIADGQGGGLSQPAWSPDGKRIAWSRYNSAGIEVLVVMDADGSNVIETLPGSFQAWSPTGEALLYLAPQTEGFATDVRFVRPDGVGSRRFRFHPDQMWGFDWAP